MYADLTSEVVHEHYIVNFIISGALHETGRDKIERHVVVVRGFTFCRNIGVYATYMLVYFLLMHMIRNYNTIFTP